VCVCAHIFTTPWNKGGMFSVVSGCVFVCLCDNSRTVRAIITNFSCYHPWSKGGRVRKWLYRGARVVINVSDTCCSWCTSLDECLPCRFRHSKDAVNAKESTSHLLIRSLLSMDETDRLLNILRDKVSRQLCHLCLNWIVLLILTQTFVNSCSHYASYHHQQCICMRMVKWYFGMVAVRWRV